MWKHIAALLGGGVVAKHLEYIRGLDTARKIKPSNVKELSAANNLMRLMPDSGMTPSERYVLHKENPETWEQEMREYNLTDEEMNIMREHLGEKLGVADSQEDIMLLSMDNRIANFTIPEANKLRKAVASINEKMLAEVKGMYYEKGSKVASKNLLDYVWDNAIMPQAGYGFSELHSSSYSLIALQNMNLAHFYPSVYWNTACLTVNSASDEDSESKKGGDYGRIASAIGDMQQRGTIVSPPDINEASYEFRPNAENNEIIFGLHGIVGVGNDVVHAVIENRPYKSFKDFLTRLYDTKMVKNSHVVQLIKAGSFEKFGDRISIMKEYANHIFTPRKKLTLASFNMIIGLDVIPEDLFIYVRHYRFRNYIFRKPIGKSPDRKTKNRLFALDQISFEFLLEHYSEDCIVDYDDSGMPIIAEYLFDREYDKKMQVVKDWLANENTLNAVNERLYQEEWEKLAGNENISKWEMSSLSYYYTEHELAHVDTEKYGLSNFYELPEDPVEVREYQWGGRTRYEYQTSMIAGTVLDKNKNRHTISLLTTDGVVTVKFYAGAYSHYDRQLSEQGADGTKTVVERSWFTRGQLLMLHGFRRGNQFIPRRYRNSIVQHTVMKIDDVKEDGSLSLTTERAYVD